MFALLEIAKTIGGPGSIGFLLLASLLIATVLWRRPAWRRAWSVVLALLFGMYIIMALPTVAARLAAALPPVPLPPDRQDQSRFDLLISLAGDNVDGRVAETARAYSVAAPHALWVLGPDWFVTRLVEAGVPAESIRQNAGPSNTRSQMQAVSGIAARNPAATIGVIASKLQMPRVASLAAAEGIPRSRLVLLASPFDGDPAAGGLRAYLPSYAALCVTRDALYEHAALAYYRWSGYIDRQALPLSVVFGCSRRARHEDPLDAWTS